MTESFRPDPRIPTRRIWRLGGGRAIGSLICGLFLVLVALGLAALALSPESLGGSARLILSAVALFVGLLAHYVLRDAWGKRGMWIAVDGGDLLLHLPAGRSLIHRPPACSDRLPLAAIRSVESRLEGYRAQGVAMLQRAYMLQCRNRPPIFLFEDRGLTSGVETRDYAPIAGEIAEAAGVELVELPMAQGRGGILGVWFTRAPDWSAAPMSLADQQKLIQRVLLTSAIAALATTLVLILALL